jgi:MOSC domain-containing protein YiiM
MPAPESNLAKLMKPFPQKGVVTWIGLRPAHRTPVEAVQMAEISLQKGLVGDHFTGKTSKNRQVTLIQAEHLEAVASFMGCSSINPGLIRRNIVVKGINLLALKDQRFRIGEALLEMTGLCHPCSRMEENLGEGGYNAMRGHGGITAKVVEGGIVRVGDSITVVEKPAES